jgi:hypothetical protein
MSFGEEVDRQKNGIASGISPQKAAELAWTTVRPALKSRNS